MSQRSLSSGRERNSASRAAIAAMKRRRAQLCETPEAVPASCSPTG
jgi:hypothetical protein